MSNNYENLTIALIGKYEQGKNHYNKKRKDLYQLQALDVFLAGFEGTTYADVHKKILELETEIYQLFEKFTYRVGCNRSKTGTQIREKQICLEALWKESFTFPRESQIGIGDEHKSTGSSRRYPGIEKVKIGKEKTTIINFKNYLRHLERHNNYL